MRHAGSHVERHRRDSGLPQRLVCGQHDGGCADDVEGARRHGLGHRGSRRTRCCQLHRWLGNRDQHARCAAVGRTSHITTSRSTFITWFAWAILALIAVLPVLGLAVAWLFITNRRVSYLEYLGWFIGLVLALPFLRRVLPGDPPLGLSHRCDGVLLVLGGCHDQHGARRAGVVPAEPPAPS